MKHPDNLITNKQHEEDEHAYEKLMEEYKQYDEEEEKDDDDGYSTTDTDEEDGPNQEECNEISAHLARLERELKTRSVDKCN